MMTSFCISGHPFAGGLAMGAVALGLAASTFALAFGAGHAPAPIASRAALARPQQTTATGVRQMIPMSPQN
jgi:hypothetical protein